MIFKGTTPCKNCPYRKDAPLALWDIEEFKDLIATENTMMGGLYGCHKKDDTVCNGWLINQDNNRLPSIRLRMALSKAGITREYMDKLHCKSPMFETVQEMAEANFPELKIK